MNFGCTPVRNLPAMQQPTGINCQPTSSNKALLARGRKMPSLHLPFLFAGRIVEADSASLYALLSSQPVEQQGGGGGIVGLMVSSIAS